jgi:hypothetical protein
MPVIIPSAAVNPNARLSLISITLAMIVPIAFALIIRRYLLRGMLSGALQQGASGSTRPASLVGYNRHVGTMNTSAAVVRGGAGP